MYVIIAPIQIKHDFKAEFIEAMILDAKGSVENEPGCLRFDIIQDADHSDRIWLYEVYKDEAAFKEHTQDAPYQEVAGNYQGLARSGPLRRGPWQPHHLAPGRKLQVGAGFKPAPIFRRGNPLWLPSPPSSRLVSNPPVGTGRGTNPPLPDPSPRAAPGSTRRLQSRTPILG